MIKEFKGFYFTLIFSFNDLAIGLECYVGRSEGYAKMYSVPEYYPVPPKLMDCKLWYPIRHKATLKEIKYWEEYAETLKGKEK